MNTMEHNIVINSAKNLRKSTMEFERVSFKTRQDKNEEAKVYAEKKLSEAYSLALVVYAICFFFAFLWVFILN